MISFRRSLRQKILATNMSRLLAEIEPPTFVGQNKLYEMNRIDLKLWSIITEVLKKSQAEVVVCNLGGHSSNIGEKIQDEFWEKLRDNKQGMEHKFT